MMSFGQIIATASLVMVAAAIFVIAYFNEKLVQEPGTVKLEKRIRVAGIVGIIAMFSALGGATSTLL